MEILRNHLETFEENCDLLSQIMTDDENWVHHWNPKTKSESKQWVHKGSPPPKEARTEPSAQKLMAIVFWDIRSILLIEYIPKGITIKVDNYAITLKNLRKAINEKRPMLTNREVFLLHDNPRVHKAAKIQHVRWSGSFPLYF